MNARKGVPRVLLGSDVLERRLKPLEGVSLPLLVPLVVPMRGGRKLARDVVAHRMTAEVAAAVFEIWLDGASHLARERFVAEGAVVVVHHAESFGVYGPWTAKVSLGNCCP